MLGWVGVWVGGREVPIGVHAASGTTLQCLLRGLVGWAGVGGRDISNNISTYLQVTSTEKDDHENTLGHITPAPIRHDRAK